MNSPDSSPQGGKPCSGADRAVVRWRWLPWVSLALAVELEVFPTEAGVLFALILQGKPIVWHKIAFLAAILLPLEAYVLRNGWRGVKAAKAAILAVGFIVVAKVILDVYVLWQGR